MVCRRSIRTSPALLFTENETNFERLFGVRNAGPFVKDGFHDTIVGGRADKSQSRPPGHESGSSLSRDHQAGRMLWR